jgi:hypothetical protein
LNFVNIDTNPSISILTDSVEYYGKTAPGNYTIEITSSNNRILGINAGQKIKFSRVGDSVTFFGVSNGNWIIQSVYGASIV